MTDKEIKNYNAMRMALVTITKFQTPEVMRTDSMDDWGLEFDECIEYAYDNIQTLAEETIKNIKPIPNCIKNDKP